MNVTLRLRYLMLVTCLVLSLGVRAQDPKDGHARALEYNSSASMPPKLITLLQKHRLHETCVPVFDEVNPFYLCGDFDGDGIRDYAVLLKLKGNAAQPGSRIAVLRGNGKLNWLDDSLRRAAHPGPAWWVFYKDEPIRTRSDLNDGPRPKLLGDGFIVARPQSSSALIYWDGERFSLYWQSD